MKPRGMTLIELLVVIAMVGILSSLVFTFLKNSNSDPHNTKNVNVVTIYCRNYTNSFQRILNKTVDDYRAISIRPKGVIQVHQGDVVDCLSTVPLDGWVMTSVEASTTSGYIEFGFHRSESAIIYPESIE